MKLPEPRYTVSDVNHRYTIAMADGSKVGPLKSVTGVLGIIAKPALVPWAAREAANYFKTEILRLGRSALDPAMLEQISKDAANAHRKKATDAASLGTMAHNICESIIKGEEPADIPVELTSAIHAFKAWRLSSRVEIVATELAVASAEHRFGGRLDAIGYSQEKDEWRIIDLKTSGAVYQEHSYQCGGYAIAFEEMYGIKIMGADIVRLGKKFPFDSAAHPITDMEAANVAFMNALALLRCEENKLIGEATFQSASVQPMPETKKKKSAPAMGF